MKVCARCKVSKDEKDFDVEMHKGKPYLGLCLICHNQYMKDYVKKYRSNEGFKKMHREAARRYVQKFPEKQKAHEVANKNKDKLLKKACEKCGATSKLHMHHPDYSKPEYVLTLCVQCHYNIHHGVA